MPIKTMTAIAVWMAGIGFAAAAEQADYTIVDGYSIPEPLTAEAGDATRGKGVFTGRKLGNCLACHQVTALEDEQQWHGEIGPSLDGVANRYSVGELRLQVVNSKVINPDTIMPAFYRTDGFNRVVDKLEGQPILTAGQVEDLLAYLATFTEE